MKNILNLYLLTFSILLIQTGLVAAQTESEQMKVEQKKSIVGVTTSELETLAFLPSRNAPARVEALSRSLIPAEISAVVESIDRRVGDQFKSGEQLATLDCKDQRLALANQQAQMNRLTDNLEFEKRQFTRGKQLAKQKTIGEAELDRLQTNVKIAEAQSNSQKAVHSSAQLGVKRCQIIAPYNGVVVKRIANAGEMVAAGTAIIEIVELGNSEVSALVSLTDTDSYLASNNFELESQGKRFRLKSRALLPVVNETSRTREARLEFDSESALAGIASRLYWYSPFYHLPANLLQQRNGSVGIFILNGNRAEFIETPGAQEGRPVLLSEFEQWRGKQLIIDGRHGLVDGQTVKQTDSNITSKNTNKTNNQSKSISQPREG